MANSNSGNQAKNMEQNAAEETHPFKPYYFENATVLIIGSFPCFNGKDYGDWFYSGSGKNDFWKLLSETFNLPASNLREKKHLCLQNNIAITDVACKVIRTKNNCSDSNLKITAYNEAGIEKCLTGKIKKVLFTGKFVERLFKCIFQNFGIPTDVLLSPSPAANRYIAGLDDYKEKLKNNKVKSIYEYKLSNYKNLLSK